MFNQDMSFSVDSAGLPDLAGLAPGSPEFDAAMAQMRRALGPLRVQSYEDVVAGGGGGINPTSELETFLADYGYGQNPDGTPVMPGSPEMLAIQAQRMNEVRDPYGNVIDPNNLPDNMRIEEAPLTGRGAGMPARAVFKDDYARQPGDPGYRAQTNHMAPRNLGPGNRRQPQNHMAPSRPPLFGENERGLFQSPAPDPRFSDMPVAPRIQTMDMRHWTDPITGKEEIGSTTARNYRNNLKKYFGENEGAEDYYNQQQAPIIEQETAQREARAGRQDWSILGHQLSPQEIARQQEAKAAYQASPAFAAAVKNFSQPLRGSPLQQIGAGSSPFGSGNMRQAVMGQPSPRQAQFQGIVPMLGGPRGGLAGVGFDTSNLTPAYQRARRSAFRT